MDLLRPVAWTGARIVAVAPPADPVRFSRVVDSFVPAPDPFSEQELLERLERAVTTPEAAVLYYQEDRELLMISKHRARLAQRFRFALPDPDLVTDLVDKARFQRLAERLGLPVPQARLVSVEDLERTAPPMPAVVKPLNRTADWQGLGIAAKAVEVHDAEALRGFARRVAPSFRHLLVQEAVPGGEDRIESYHVYVDDGGAIAGEFTGRKIRTYPQRFGHTTSLRTTAAEDVRALGRDITHRIGLRGVGKLDFKRAPDGRLWLLEVNPRFNLWHHVGAAAGVNLPALVLADLTGTARPPAAAARAGVTWSAPLRDLRAARAGGTSLVAWLRWAPTCDTYETLALRDPVPFARAVLWPAVRRRLPRLPSRAPAG